MRRIDALLADYASSHRTRGNLACHAVGITLIVFGVLSMLHAIPLRGPWTASEALLAAAFLVYMTASTSSIRQPSSTSRTPSER